MKCILSVSLSHTHPSPYFQQYDLLSSKFWSWCCTNLRDISKKHPQTLLKSRWWFCGLGCSLRCCIFNTLPGVHGQGGCVLPTHHRWYTTHADSQPLLKHSALTRAAAKSPATSHTQMHHRKGLSSLILQGQDRMHWTRSSFPRTYNWSQ